MTSVNAPHPHHSSIRDCSDAVRSPFSLLASAYGQAYCQAAQDSRAAPPNDERIRISRRTRLLVGAFAVSMAAIAAAAFEAAAGLPL